MVIYDEIETFRKHTDLQFNYPYGLRKTSIQNIQFKNAALAPADEDINGDGDANDFEYEQNYEYFSTDV